MLDLCVIAFHHANTINAQIIFKTILILLMLIIKTIIEIIYNNKNNKILIYFATKQTASVIFSKHTQCLVTYSQ